MKFKSYIIFLLVLVFGNIISSVEAVKYDEVTINELPSMLSDAKKGYSVYHFMIENNTNSTQKITLNLKDGYYESGLDVKKEVELQKREKKEEKIFIPNGFGYGTPKVEFFVNRVKIGTINLKKGSAIIGNGTYGDDRIFFLADDKISKPDLSKTFKDPGFDWRQKEKYVVYQFGGGTSELDKDWIAYTQYDALMYYAYTFVEEMPANVQSAIIDYIKAGGHLILLSSNEYLEKINNIDKSRELSISGFSKKKNGLIKRYSVGLGIISIYDDKLFEKIKSTPSSTTSSTSSSGGYRSNYSRNRSSRNSIPTSTSTSVSVSTSTSKSIDLVTPFVEKIYEPKDVVESFGFKGNSPFSKNYLTDNFVVAKRYGRDFSSIVPAGILSFLVLFFACLMGPVNFVVLKIYDKKILFFLTVPILSFICCSLVFLVYYSTEYNRLDVQRMSFTLLDENNNNSITVGAESILSGKTLNYELSFPLSSVVIPSEYSSRRNETTKSIVIDKNQNFTTGWIRPKSPLSYMVCSNKLDRSRIEINKNNGDSIEITNALGADIIQIFMVTNDGIICSGSNIKSGKSGLLNKNNYGDSKFSNRKKEVINYLPLFEFINKRDINDIKLKDKNIQEDIKNELIDYSSKVLKAGEYIVLLKSSPFMNQKLDSRASIQELGCFVHGILKR